jgi:hypothetical protein
MDSLLGLKRYHLRLGNDQHWQIIGANRAARLAEKLASIMQLETYDGDGAPRLILKQWEAADRAAPHPGADAATGIATDLPRHGWRSYCPFSHLHTLRRYFPDFRVFLHPDVPDAIFEIKPLTNCGQHLTDLPRRSMESRRRVETRKRLELVAETNILREVIHTIYRHVPRSGGLVLHSAIAAFNGTGVLLLGSSGAGKSTSCRRLPPIWQRMGDEEALILPNDRGQYLGHAFPTWSNFVRERGERSWAVERCVPLAAIFLLQKAETDEVTPVGKGEAALWINNSTMEVWDPDSKGCPNLAGDTEWPPRRMLFENACAIAGSVPAFILRVSLAGRFWEEIERALSRLPDAVNHGQAASAG